jgi:porin-like protein
MNTIRSILLGTAAGLVAVAGAQAADMPVKAKPVQYVKICTLYGDGFYYVPGTNTCLKLGGYVRVQAEYNAGGGGVVDGTAGQQAQAMYDRVRTNDVDYRVRGALSIDARDQTEYGTLRSYFRIGVNQTTPADGTGGAVFWDRAFIQFAGFTVGKAQSFFDTVTYGGAYSYHNVRTVSDTGASGWNIWAYTAQFGNGFSGTLSLEDPNRNRTVIEGTSSVAAFPASIAITTDNAFGAQSATNNGFRMPDVILNLRWDQTWGYVSVSGALHDLAGAYYGFANNVANGHPTDKKGWAVGAGALFNLAGGDKFGINGQYSEGAAGYGSALGQVWSILKPGTSIGIGFQADGVFDTGREIELTRVWNIIAFYEHVWNPRWKTSVYGGYVKTDYNEAATNIINSHLPGAAGTLVCGVPVAGAVWPPLGIAPGTGNSCNPDFDFYQVGTRTQWNPAPNLDIGVEFLYTRLNTAYKGPALAGGVAPGAPQQTVFTIDDQNVFSTFFRWQRNFYP